MSSTPPSTGRGPAIPAAPASTVSPLAPDELRRIRRRLARAIDELGVAYTVQDEARSDPLLGWSIDPEPVVLEAAEWATIESAIAQRARLINCLLADLYGPQETLRAERLPAELILGDPAFRRPCVNLEPNRRSLATVLRFDLLRDENGQWLFLDTSADTPIGAGFAVQTRRLMLQERGDFYAALPDFRRIVDFPVDLLNALRALSPRAMAAPNIVVLTSGPHDPAFIEHSLLARKMGLPLAQGGDLLVLNEEVFFKSVSGLVRVDVIYRRVSDGLIDPVVFPASTLTGVPGLIGAIRAGNVAVANAPGTAIANNRALEPHIPALSRYFLGERPPLRSVETYNCGDRDQLALAVDGSRDDLVFEPANPAHEELGHALRKAASRGREALLRVVARHCRVVVARRIPRRSLETFGQMSCFALCDGPEIQVMPGALLRIVPVGKKTDPAAWTIGAVRDVVVLDGQETRRRDTADEDADRTQPAQLGSRTAENLFWVGRYTERAEGAARMLSIIGDVGLEEISLEDRRAWFPIWEGLLEATGHAGAAKKQRQPWITPALARQMTIDPANPSSLLSSVRAARWNASQIRDVLSPEAWSFLNRLGDQLESLRSRKHTSGNRLAHEAVSHTIDDLNAFFGAVDRTMLKDSAWHFLHAGILLERAIMTCLCLRNSIAEAEAAVRAGIREEADLAALIRMLSSQDAYRRIYRARVEPLYVAELFLLNTQAPKGVRSCLVNLADHLEAISLLTGSDDAPLRHTREILSGLEKLDIEAFFPRRTNNPPLIHADEPPPPANTGTRSMPEKPHSLADWLNHLLEHLNAVGQELHDHDFTHHARIARNPPQAAPAGSHTAGP